MSMGAHVPRLRLSRAQIAAATSWLYPAARLTSGERAICNWDEDSITLAVEAGRSALAESANAVSAVALASTSLPFADRDNAGLVASALDLPIELDTLNITSSQTAGTAALINAARRASGTSLVIASEARRTQVGSPQELSYGDAAAALVVGRVQRGAIAEIVGIHQVTADFVDHYRATDATFDYALEERWVRDAGWSEFVPAAINGALRAAGLGASEVTRLLIPVPATVAQRIAKLATIGSAALGDDLFDVCGHAGAAQPLLQLVAALERASPGDNLLVVSVGQGADAVVLRVTDAAARRRRPVRDSLANRQAETSYVRYLSHAGLLTVDFGMRAERDNRTAQSVAWRKHRAVTAFVGGRCSACQTVQFPKSRACVNPDCRRYDTQTDYRLADSRGRIKTFTEDWQAYSPRPPSIYGNVEFDAGGNLLMEVTDCGTGELAVGDQVQFVFRIKDVDRLRHFKRYFWKAAKV